MRRFGLTGTRRQCVLSVRTELRTKVRALAGANFSCEPQCELESTVLVSTQWHVHVWYTFRASLVLSTALAVSESDLLVRLAIEWRRRDHPARDAWHPTAMPFKDLYTW